jgi:sugar fermentation stimulation protein A
MKEAVFIERHNRFVGLAKVEGRAVHVYIPNTGRLTELLLPGRKVILVPSTGVYAWKLLYVIYNNRPVLIDSISSNRIFHGLLNTGAVPGMEEYAVVRREPPYGNHRFDYLMRGPRGEFFAELKSCTLAWNGVAAFPDAVSARATEHVRALAESGRGMLIFLILHEKVSRFFPNYHTDFSFYKALHSARNDIEVKAYSAHYDSDFNVADLERVTVEIPAAEPRGAYVLILRNDEDAGVEVGRLGLCRFRKGYYLYAGSGGNNLFKRIEHHRRGGRVMHWHIDYLTRQFKITADLPVVTHEDLECRIAASISCAGYRCVERFGSSDCSCPGHLFYSETNPLGHEDFIGLIYGYRFGAFGREG